MLPGGTETRETQLGRLWGRTWLPVPGEKGTALGTENRQPVPEVASGRSRRAIGARGAEQRSHGWLGKASLAPTATCSSTGKTGMGAAR
jgi:hypothetical protein